MNRAPLAIKKATLSAAIILIPLFGISQFHKQSISVDLYKLHEQTVYAWYEHDSGIRASLYYVWEMAWVFQEDPKYAVEQVGLGVGYKYYIKDSDKFSFSVFPYIDLVRSKTLSRWGTNIAAYASASIPVLKVFRITGEIGYGRRHWSFEERLKYNNTWRVYPGLSVGLNL